MTGRRRQRKAQDGLVDAGRAAELLGYSYNAIINAVEAGALKAESFERKGGKESPLILKSELERYRLSLIQRYKTIPGQAARLADLKKRKVLV